VLTARKEIQENLQVRYPQAKITVKKATERAGASVAYIAVIRNIQTSEREAGKIRILSFNSSGKEIQNADV